MNSLPTTSTAATATGLKPADPKLQRSISDLTIFTPDDGKPVVLRAAAAPELRSAVVARITDIDDATRRRDRGEVERIVLVLLAMYSLARNEEGSAAAVVAGYVSTLADVPVTFVAEAARAWTKGEATNQQPGKPPMPDELYAEAKRRWDRAGGERLQLMRFLSGVVDKPAAVIAPKPTEEELRAKYGEDWGLKPAAETDKGSAAGRRRRSMDEANQRAFERDCAHHGVDPALGVSPTLLAMTTKRTDDAEAAEDAA